MATRQNLIDTYQNNPTLQSRYTQQQYLDMFGFGQSTPTPTPTPPPTKPAPPADGIQNIIGQNLREDPANRNLVDFTDYTTFDKRKLYSDNYTFKNKKSKRRMLKSRYISCCCWNTKTCKR